MSESSRYFWMVGDGSRDLLNTSILVITIPKIFRYVKLGEPVPDLTPLMESDIILNDFGLSNAHLNSFL